VISCSLVRSTRIAPPNTAGTAESSCDFFVPSLSPFAFRAMHTLTSFTLVICGPRVCLSASPIVGASGGDGAAHDSCPSGHEERGPWRSLGAARRVGPAVDIDAFGLHRGYVAVKGEQIVAAASLHDYPLLMSRGGTASFAVRIGLGQGRKGSWREPAEVTWTGKKRRPRNHLGRRFALPP
jgi:hypothetical protein